MNKLKTLAAAAALAMVGSAHALTPAQVDAARTAGTLKEVYISGSSALRLSIAAYLQEVCNGDMDAFFDSATGSNHRAYSCTLKAKTGNYNIGTPVLVYKRDQGGSGQGVNPVAQATPIAHMVVSDAACTATGNPSPIADIQLASYTCGTTASVVSDAGISDVEPSLLQQSINLPSGATALTTAELGNLDVAPLVQAIFGVAVNTNLYRALQATQGLTQDDADANQPTVSAEFVRAALTGQIVGSGTAKKGWNLVVSSAVDAGVNSKQVNVCRRAKGSGTQAGSNVLFAGNPCNSGTGALNPLAATGTVAQNGTVAVVENSSSGAVETCLGTTVEGAGGYGLGILGRENNPLANGGDKHYRYVKLDGVAPLRIEAKAGNYPFFFESTMQWNKTVVTPGSDKALFLAAIRTNAGKPASLAKADVDTQNGVMSPPATYTGAYVDQTGDNANFGSRVSRVSGNSCALPRIVK